MAEDSKKSNGNRLPIRAPKATPGQSKPPAKAEKK